MSPICGSRLLAEDVFAQLPWKNGNLAALALSFLIVEQRVIFCKVLFYVLGLHCCVALARAEGANHPLFTIPPTPKHLKQEQKSVLLVAGGQQEQRP